MPLHVDIRINDRLLHTLHIGRVSGGTSPDSINSYVVVEGDEPQSKSEWLAGTPYEHRYGDGAKACVMKAIQAMKENDE
jgi:hypothetical protein